ncbi:START domain-containing protein [Pseudoalteromonas sp. GB56]
MPRAIPSLIGAISVALVVLPQSVAAQPTWRTWKAQDQLNVSFAKNEQGRYAIKAKVLIANANAAQFVSLLHDTEHAPDWLEGVKQVRLLASPQPHHSHVFTLLNSPWPVADRELYSLSCYERLNEAQTKLIIKAVQSDSEVPKGRVRIEDLQASWLISEQPTGLLLEYEVEADPAGAIPNWISNKVSLKSVYRTLSNLRARLANTQVMSPMPLTTGQCQDFSQSSD